MPQVRTISAYARYVKKWVVREHIFVEAETIPVIAVDLKAVTFNVIEFDFRDISGLKQTEFEELIDKKFFSAGKMQWVKANVSPALQHQRIFVSRILNATQAQVLSDLSIENWNWRAMQAGFKEAVRRDVASSDAEGRFYRGIFYPA